MFAFCIVLWVVLKNKCIYDVEIFLADSQKGTPFLAKVADDKTWVSVLLHPPKTCVVLVQDFLQWPL